MKIMIFPRNEGLLDTEFKDGDIFQVKPDSWTPGSEETKVWLVIKVPDFGGSWDELIAPEYSVGPDNQPTIRRMRKYRVDYAAKLTPSELAAAKDINVSVPVIEDRFTLDDIIRK